MSCATTRPSVDPDGESEVSSVGAGADGNVQPKTNRRKTIVARHASLNVDEFIFHKSCISPQPLISSTPNPSPDLWHGRSDRGQRRGRDSSSPPIDDLYRSYGGSGRRVGVATCEPVDDRDEVGSTARKKAKVAEEVESRSATELSSSRCKRVGASRKARGRGRPRLVRGAADEGKRDGGGVRRGRGRPRSLGGAADEGKRDEGGVRRGRGRPRLVRDAADEGKRDEGGVRRGRGRPCSLGGAADEGKRDAGGVRRGRPCSLGGAAGGGRPGATTGARTDDAQLRDIGPPVTGSRLRPAGSLDSAVVVADRTADAKADGAVDGSTGVADDATDDIADKSDDVSLASSDDRPLAASRVSSAAVAASIDFAARMEDALAGRPDVSTDGLARTPDVGFSSMSRISDVTTDASDASETR